MQRALTDIHDDPEQARALLGEYLKNSNPKALDALMPILVKEVPAAPTVEEKAYQTAVKFHLDSGLVRKAPEYGNVIPEAFRS
jgi:hypothetical protein